MGRPQLSDEERQAGRWLLAIDTSTERAGVALTDGDTSESLAWNARRAQTTTLLRAIQELLRLAQLSMADVAAVGVTVGPGTFNGLRVGLATAKGFVLGQGMPIVGVGTLDATAYPYLLTGRPVAAVAAAGRGRLVTATYLPGPATPESEADAAPFAGWQVDGPTNERVADLAKRLAVLPQGSWLVGELTPAQIAELSPIIQSRLLAVPPGPLRERTPVAVAALAWERWQRGCMDDPATLVPVYLHGQSPAVSRDS